MSRPNAPFFDLPTPSPQARADNGLHSGISIDVPSPEPLQRQHATARQDCRLDEQPDATARRMIQESDADFRRANSVEAAITHQLYQQLPSAHEMQSAQQRARIGAVVARLYEWHRKAALAPEDRWSAKAATRLCKFPELAGNEDYEALICRLRDLGYRPFVRAHALYIRLPNCLDQTPTFGCSPTIGDNN